MLDRVCCAIFRLEVTAALHPSVRLGNGTPFRAVFSGSLCAILVFPWLRAIRVRMRRMACRGREDFFTWLLSEMPRAQNSLVWIA